MDHSLFELKFSNKTKTTYSDVFKNDDNTIILQKCINSQQKCQLCINVF